MIPFSQKNLVNNENHSTEELPSQANTNSENDIDGDDTNLLYTNESLLPQVDWENLERQLKQAQIERERYDKVFNRV